MYMLCLDFHQLALTVILAVADLEVVTLEALSSYSQQLKYLR
jgi:hypothetical protein